MTLNNIDKAQCIAYKKEIQTTPAEAKFTAKIEGDWLFEEGGPQFRSNVKVQDGMYALEASYPNLAGPGCRPGPMAFGLFWFAASYSSTFVTEAAVRNIPLTSVKTRVEADLDYTAQFDLGNNPLIHEYRVFLDVKGDVSESQVQDLKEYALKRCMGMFTIQHAIPLKAEVRLQK
ncbi:OsmC family protein [Methanoregula sp.]|uniref:OsmC family protein n=1 Tax=Methanoregula sp. TaxID=2052170 RepID=UPI000CAEE104|nr:OsmC family protein [Methanoregula sp.]PKG31205.1 MAG: osmotically inducible protein OsmC [Methanoregula sp.]